MRRRTFLIALSLPAAARAAPSTDMLDFVSAIAGDLADNDLRDFLKHVDPAMPGYAILKDDVETLLSAKDVESEIEMISEEGDQRKRSLELDWVLITRDKEVINGRQVTQRVRVKCSVTRQAKTWTLTNFDPIRLFKL